MRERQVNTLRRNEADLHAIAGTAATAARTNEKADAKRIVEDYEEVRSHGCRKAGRRYRIVL